MLSSTFAPQQLDREQVAFAAEREIRDQLEKYAGIKNPSIRIEVDSERKIVVLAGIVLSEKLRIAALEFAEAAHTGFAIRSKLFVALPRSAFTEAMAERERSRARSSGEVIGPTIDDAWLHCAVSARLRSDITTAGQSAINIDVLDGSVTLRGIVASAGQKNAAEQLVQSLDGVKQLTSELRTVLEAGKSYPTHIV